MAADELVRFPHLAVQDMAAGLGFNNASSFTRAFRRAYDIAPQELHAYAPLAAARARIAGAACWLAGAAFQVAARAAYFSARSMALRRCSSPNDTSVNSPFT
jgi:AraC-like DNA-binding protein